jgi:hypothetical protein
MNLEPRDAVAAIAVLALALLGVIIGAAVARWVWG